MFGGGTAPAAPTAAPAGTPLFGGPATAPAAGAAATPLFGGPAPPTSSTPAAATTTLFGGGGSAAPAAAPAAATGTLSFGGPATASSAPAKTKPLFGGAATTSAPLFGGAAPATSAPAAPPLFGGATTSGPAATGATPAPGAAAAPAAPAPAAPRAAPAPAAPSEVRGKTVEEIVNQWNRELEYRSRAFVTSAKALAECDRIVLQNRSTLFKLEEDIGSITTSQDSLNRQLEVLEMHQRQVNDALRAMEQEAERVFAEERSMCDAGDPALERDSLYEMAEEVGAQLAHMSDDLREAVTLVNARVDEHHSNLSEPVAAIVSTLNNQMRALSWIEKQTAELKSNMDVLLNG